MGTDASNSPRPGRTPRGNRPALQARPKRRNAAEVRHNLEVLKAGLDVAAFALALAGVTWWWWVALAKLIVGLILLALPKP